MQGLIPPPSPLLSGPPLSILSLGWRSKSSSTFSFSFFFLLSLRVYEIIEGVEGWGHRATERLVLCFLYLSADTFMPFFLLPLESMCGRSSASLLGAALSSQFTVCSPKLFSALVPCPPTPAPPSWEILVENQHSPSYFNHF